MIVSLSFVYHIWMFRMFPFVQPTLCSRQNEHSQMFWRWAVLVLLLDTNGTYQIYLVYPVPSHWQKRWSFLNTKNEQIFVFYHNKTKYEKNQSIFIQRFRLGLTGLILVKLTVIKKSFTKRPYSWIRSGEGCLVSFKIIIYRSTAFRISIGHMKNTLS